MKQKIIIPPSSTDQTVTIDIADPVITVSGGTPIPEPNQAPEVSAKNPGSVQLPQATVILQGEATDLDGAITSVIWTQTKGPVAQIRAENFLVCEISGLQAGDYGFNLKVTDDDGATSSADIFFSVLPAVVGTVKKFPVTVTQRTDKYPRPGCGMEYWNVAAWNDKYAVRVPEGNENAWNRYYRFNWFDIQKDSGAYDFTIFDGIFNDAIKKGQSVSFGIMPQCGGCDRAIPGGSSSIPLIYHNQMLKEANPTWLYDGVWIPNWNSEIYLSAWEQLLKAVSDHIAEKKWEKVINYIDIRGYGNWGEWHTYPYTGASTGYKKATVATLKRIVDSHINAFPNYPLVNMMGAYDLANDSRIPVEAAYYALTAKNSWGDIGFRRDNWGDAGYDAALANSTATFNGVKFKDIILNKYKTAYVVGEPANDKTAISRNCGAMHCDLVREVKLYHIDLLGNGNYPSVDAAVIKNVREADDNMGYRIGITSGEVRWGPEIEIELNWVNTQGPAKNQWTCELSIGTWKAISKFQPTLFLGAKTVIDQYSLPQLAPGTYDLKVNIIDPSGYRKNLPLNSVVNCKITL